MTPEYPELQAARAPSVGTARGEGPGVALDFSRVRFLVMDDHDASVEILRALLRVLGAKQVAAVKSKAAALTALSKDAPDILLLDLLLGDGSGLDLLKAIRRPDHPRAFLPVIVVSAYADQARVEATRDAGADEVLAKPVSAQELFRRIVSVVGDRRPFVRLDGYFGPDRRRRDDPDYQGPERRALPAVEEPEAGAA